MLLLLVVLRREGHRFIPPIPAQAWKWLLGWVPTGVVSGGRHMREHTAREEKGSLSRECGCSTDGEEQGTLGGARKVHGEITRTLSMHHVGRALDTII